MFLGGICVKRKKRWLRWIAWTLLLVLCMNSAGTTVLAVSVEEENIPNMNSTQEGEMRTEDFIPEESTSLSEETSKEENTSPSEETPGEEITPPLEEIPEEEITPSQGEISEEEKIKNIEENLQRGEISKDVEEFVMRLMRQEQLSNYIVRKQLYTF